MRKLLRQRRLSTLIVKALYRSSVPFPLHSSAAAHSHCGGIAKRLIGCACSAADIKLARPARARLPAGIVRRQLAARARLDQYGRGRAGYSHIGGFLAGLLAFAAFDLIPISTGGSPNEGMDAPPPAINLDTIAGCALLAMPRRSRRRSACAANAVLVVIPARGAHHLVQTA